MSRLHDNAARRMRRQLHSINKMLVMGAPDFLVAESVLLLWENAELFCGEELYRALGRRAMGDARRRAATCCSCDSAVNADVCEPPQCELCHARYMDEIREIDRLEHGGD